MKKTGPPGPRPKPKKRKRRARARDDPTEQFTLHYKDIKVGATTYRVFLRVPINELDVVTSAAVAAHLGGKKPVIVAVRAEVRELRDVMRDLYKEEE